MPQARTGRLVVAGKLVVDEVLTCAQPLTPGSAQRAVSREVTGGGQVWHTARAARHAGAAVAVTGWCGSDADTARLRAELGAAGIDDRLVPAGEAPRAVVLVGPDGERTIVSSGGAAHLPADALDPGAVLDGAGWLHLDGYCLDDRAGAALTALAAAAHRLGMPVSVEPPAIAALPHRSRWLPELPPLAALLGRTDENAAAARLLTTPPACVVSHAGAQPVVTTSAGGAVETPVPSRRVATTGAGDRFAGGWLAARLRGAALDQAAAAGVAAAQSA